MKNIFTLVALVCLFTYANAQSGCTAFISGITTICNGQSDTLIASGGANYEWSDGATTSSIIVSPVTDATYSVTATTGTCVATASITITVNPSAADFTYTTVCLGDTTQFTDQSNFEANLWNWNFGDGNTSSLQDPVNTYTSAGTYSVTLDVNSIKGCNSTIVKTVTVLPLPDPNLSVTPDTCNANKGIVFSSPVGSSPFTFVWFNGSTTSAVSGLGIGNYSVTVTDANGCAANSTINISNAIPSSPSICMVTVDSLSQYNVIVWDKTGFSSIDSFIVYRETSSNNYMSLGSVPFNGLSLFVDTVRARYFPYTGNPNSGTYRYKIGIHDVCNQSSALSPYHNTIYVTNNNGTFSWAQPYTIENSVNPVTSYWLMRDDNSTGNWHVVNAVSGSQQSVTDAQYSTYQNTASWRVQTQWSISCTPALKDPLPNTVVYNNSLSNTYSSSLTAVNNLIDENVIHISPNPSSGKFNVQISKYENGEIKIYDVLGELVYHSTNQQLNNSIIDLSADQSGIYFLQLRTSDGVVTKKLVVSH